MTAFSDKRHAGLLLALASYGLYSLHYATMKWLGEDYSLWQLIFIRSLVMLVITLGVGRLATIKATLASRYKLSAAFRAALQFGSALCFYIASAAMPLSDVTTLYSTAPLMVAVFSVLILKERSNTLQWVAVVVGLIGTAVAANPGGNAFLPVPTLFAIGSALFWAMTVIFTRQGGARERSDVQLLLTSLVFMTLSVGAMSWQTPSDYFDWLLMIALGLQIYLAQLCFIEACKYVPASIVGPMEYSSLLWAGLFGFLLFAEVPTIEVFVGGAIVVASGIVLAIGLPRMTRKASN